MYFSKKYAIIGALLVSMSASTVGCSTVWDMIKPSGGISSEIVVGDKALNTEVVGSKKTTTNTAEEISQVFNTINEAEPILPWLVAILFLMLPTPTRMGMGIRDLFKRKKNAKERTD